MPSSLFAPKKSIPDNSSLSTKLRRNSISKNQRSKEQNITGSKNRNHSRFALWAWVSTLIASFVMIFGASSAQASLSDAVLSDSPAAYWHLDEPAGSTTLADASGGGYSGSRIAPAVLGNPGRVGTAMTANGSMRSSLPLTSSMSAEFWVKMPTSRTADTLIAQQYYENYSTRYNLWDIKINGTNQASAGKVNWNVKLQGTTTITSQGRVDDGQWHHVAITANYDATDAETTLQLYVDGQPALEQQLQAPGTFYINTSANNNNTFFGSGTSSSALADTLIDEAAIYSRALSSGQINQHITAAQSGAGSAPTFVENLAYINGTFAQIGRPLSVPRDISEGEERVAVDWERCKNGICTSIIQAGSQYVYRPTNADLGFTIKANYHAFNQAGKTTTSTESQTVQQSRYVKSVLDDQPSAYWRLDDSNARPSLVDLSGNSSSAVKFASGNLGNSGALSEASRSMTVNGGMRSTLSTTSSMSAEFWVKMPTRRATETIVAQQYYESYSTRYNRWDVKINGTDQASAGKLTWNVKLQGATTITSPGRVDDGQWHHVAITADYNTTDAETALQLYVDGESVLEQQMFAPGTFPYSSPAGNNNNTIFGSSTSSSAPNDALIDEVTIYSRALSSSQVNQHITAAQSEIGTVPVLTEELAYTNGAFAQIGKPLSVPHDIAQGEGRIAIEWQRCKDGTCDSIVQASGQYIYKPTNFDLGSTIKVNYYAFNQAGRAVASTESQPVQQSRYVKSIFDNQPSAYWRLDDSNARPSLVDLSGNNSSAIKFSSGNMSNSGALSEASRSMTVNGGMRSTLSTTSSMSAEFWVKMPTRRATETIIAQQYYESYSTRYNRWDIKINGTNQPFAGKLNWNIKLQGTTTITSPGRVDDGQWHHVAITADYNTTDAETALQLYVDGQSALEQQLLAPGTFLYSSPAGNNNNTIFGSGTSSSAPADTLIDEAVIYPQALSSDQINQHITAAQSEIGTVPVLTEELAYINGAFAKVGKDLTIPRDIAEGEERVAVDWQRCKNENCTPIIIASGQYVYKPTNADLGYTIKAHYHAFNQAGQVTASTESQPLQQSRYVKSVLDDQPSGYWRLDDSNARPSLVDLSGNSSSATKFSSGSMGQKGALINEASRSMTVNGGMRSTLPTTSSMSAEFWVKIPTLRATETIIAQQYYESYSTRYNRWDLKVNGADQPSAGKLTWTAKLQKYETITSKKSISDGKWHHVMITADYDATDAETALQLYVDGQSALERQILAPGTFSYNSPAGNNNNTIFGSGTSSNASTDMLIDEAVVYSRALSSNQVNQHITAAQAEAETVPVLTDTLAYSNSTFAQVGMPLTVPRDIAEGEERVAVDWERCKDGNCTSIMITSSQFTYRPINGDLGYTIKANYHAFNQAGQVTASTESQPVQQSQYVKSILDDQPSGYWRLDDSNARPSLVDLSGNNSYAAKFASGNMGNSGALSEASRSMTINGGMRSTLPTTASMSAEFWVKMPTRRATETIVAQQYYESYSTRYNRWDVKVNGTNQPSAGKLAWNVKLQKYETITSKKSISDGKWHHVMITADYDATDAETALQLYVDGQSALEQPLLAPGSFSYNNPTSNNNNTIFGSGTSSNAPTDALIDEAVIYSRALTSESVQNHITQGLFEKGLDPYITTGTGISGETKVGHKLTADRNGFHRYERTSVQWERCQGANCTTIPENNGSSIYYPAQEDIGKQLRVTVSAYNNSGSVSTAARSRTIQQSHYVQTILDDQPSGYWRLDDSNARPSLVDLSGNNSFATKFASGNMGNEGSLRSEASRSMTVNGGMRSTLPTTSSMSAEFWFKMPTRLATETIIAQQYYESYSTRYSRWDIKIKGTDQPSAGKLTWTTRLQGVPTITSSGRVDDGQWHHVAVTASYNATDNKTGLQLYVDGQVTLEQPLLAQGVFPYNSPTSNNNNTIFGSGASAPADALIDEAAVYSRALTKESILKRLDDTGSIRLDNHVECDSRSGLRTGSVLLCADNVYPSQTGFTATGNVRVQEGIGIGDGPIRISANEIKSDGMAALSLGSRVLGHAQISIDPVASNDPNGMVLNKPKMTLKTPDLGNLPLIGGIPLKLITIDSAYTFHLDEKHGGGFAGAWGIRIGGGPITVARIVVPLAIYADGTIDSGFEFESQNAHPLLQDQLNLNLGGLGSISLDKISYNGPDNKFTIGGTLEPSSVALGASCISGFPLELSFTDGMRPSAISVGIETDWPLGGSGIFLREAKIGIDGLAGGDLILQGAVKLWYGGKPRVPTPHIAPPTPTQSFGDVGPAPDPVPDPPGSNCNPAAAWLEDFNNALPPFLQNGGFIDDTKLLWLTPSPEGVPNGSNTFTLNLTRKKVAMGGRLRLFREDFNWVYVDAMLEGGLEPLQVAGSGRFHFGAGPMELNGTVGAGFGYGPNEVTSTNGLHTTIVGDLRGEISGITAGGGSIVLSEKGGAAVGHLPEICAWSLGCIGGDVGVKMNFLDDNGQVRSLPKFDLIGSGGDSEITSKITVCIPNFPNGRVCNGDVQQYSMKTKRKPAKNGLEFQIKERRDTLLVQVHGSDHAPKVMVIAPNGKKIRSSDWKGSSKNKETNSTSMLLPGAPGKWTVVSEVGAKISVDAAQNVVRLKVRSSKLKKTSKKRPLKKGKNVAVRWSASLYEQKSTATLVVKQGHKIRIIADKQALKGHYTIPYKRLFKGKNEITVVVKDGQGMPLDQRDIKPIWK